MKKSLCLLFCLFSLPLWGDSLYETEKIAVKDGAVSAAPFGTVIFQDTFAKEGIWDNAQTQNYQELLKISFGKIFDGAACLFISGEGVLKKDTAWNVATLPIPLTQKTSRFALAFQVSSSAVVTGEGDSGNMWRSAVKWLDADGKECGVQRFTFTATTRSFSEVLIDGSVPENAASAVLQFGFDRPNLDEGKYLAMRNVQFSMLGEKACQTVPGSFVSEILPGGNISWDADVPEGCSVKFQIAAATVEEKASKTAKLAFHGPDGTDKTFYTEPFSANSSWVRFKAFLVPNGKESPTLQCVRVGSRTVKNWTRRGDGFPPRVKIASATPTRNKTENLVVEITDESPLDKSGLKIVVDGVERTGEFACSGNLWTLVPKTPWADGLHTVDVTVSDFYGNINEAKKCFFLGDTPTTPKVTLRDDGMTLIDGQPFFPVGIYGVMKREFNDFDIDKAFAGLKEAGFNFAHSYSIPRSDEFLAAAQKYGFKLWTVARFPDERFINIERHHPAIIAWYLGDDTSANTTPSELYDRDDAVKALDPTRITTQADGVHSQNEISNYRDYVDGTDNFLPEIYPVRTTKPESAQNCVAITICDMKRCGQDIRDAGAGPKSIWPIIQYFQGWGWERFPTFDELNAMSFASIIHGAHGITWYTYGGTVEPEKKKFNYGVTSTPERWKNMSTVATRIQQLSPVLVERTGAQPSAPEILSGPEKDPLGNASISYLWKIHDGAAYCLCVNSSPETVTARFTFPNVKTGEVLFENRNVSLDSGKLTEEFKGFAVHVYRFSLK